MALKRSKMDEGWTGRRIDFADFSKKLAVRRETVRTPELPRNPGTRRTASKKALLKAIEATGGKW